MTLINRLINEAKGGAEVLWINSNQVEAIVEHCLACSPMMSTEENRARIRDELLSGKLLLLDVPIRIRGHQ